MNAATKSVTPTAGPDPGMAEAAAAIITAAKQIAGPIGNGTLRIS